MLPSRDFRERLIQTSCNWPARRIDNTSEMTMGTEVMSFKRIGCIGLGVMGKSMARNLKKAGFDIEVFNRSAAPVTELTAEGFIGAETPKILAEGKDAVLVCVTDGEAVSDILFGEEGVVQAKEKPSLIVDFSTISPSDAKKVAERLAKYDISYLDAPVSGGDVGAREGTLTVMAGGDPKVFESAKPLFDAVGKNIFYTGETGTGQLTKCVNQVVVASTVAAMTEGLTFAKESGLDLEKTLSIIAGGAAGSWSLTNYGPRVLKGDLAPGFDAKHMLKDIDFALSEAKNLELSLPGSECVRELFNQLCEKMAKEQSVVGNHGLIRLYEN